MASQRPDSTLSLTQTQALHGSRASARLSALELLEMEVVGLFDQHRSRLLAYIAAIGVDGHDGEEIVQEVFLSLFRHLQMGKSRSNLRGWIFRVTHNLALRQREANQRHRMRIEPDQETELAPDLKLNPEEQLLATQRQSRLLSVVAALSEQDRLCFNLRAEGLRYREIAQVLGISLGSVSMSLTRTVERLTRADEGRREGLR
jgi:RNA polymerase sigma-70 factor (ECF subfamily)